MGKEKMTVTQRQNKKLNKTGSEQYGSMTFWKNMDFWLSMFLYATLLSLVFVLAKLASLLQ
jgi:hypothetical protein